MRRPSGETMRSIAATTAASFENEMSERSRRPSRSMNTSLWRFTMISVTCSSASRDSSGPRPTTSLSTTSRRASRCSRIDSKALSVSISSSISFCTVERSSASAMRATFTRRRSIAAISMRCSCPRMAMPSGRSSGLSLTSRTGSAGRCGACGSTVTFGGAKWARASSVACAMIL